MPLTVYLDTSVVSAYFDSRTPDRQRDTQVFWQEASKNCQLIVSDVVFLEIAGTPKFEKRAMLNRLVEGLPVLLMNPATHALANEFVKENLVPEKKLEDAQHLALAIVHGLDFLVSWNFQHMVNYKTVHRLPVIAAKNQYFNRLSILSPSAFRDVIEEEK
jgi:predicted nucleic acid-binding protein